MNMGNLNLLTQVIVQLHKMTQKVGTGYENSRRPTGIFSTQEIMAAID
jgi:hypothetical protein